MWRVVLVWALAVGTVGMTVGSPFVLADASLEVVDEEVSEKEARVEPGTQARENASALARLSHDRLAASASRERGAPPTPPPER